MPNRDPLIVWDANIGCIHEPCLNELRSRVQLPLRQIGTFHFSALLSCGSLLGNSPKQTVYAAWAIELPCL
jgi:hypothetical protein